MRPVFESNPNRSVRNAVGHCSFTIPIENRYFEDYVEGSEYEFGLVIVEEAEIIAFAQRFDPQVFHTNAEAAEKTVYGGLIASGWHTASLTMRLFAEHYLSKVASLGSPGIDELRWLRPVRPGDELSICVTTRETNRSRSKPDRGIVRSFVETLNQKRELVMSMEVVNFLLCRD